MPSVRPPKFHHPGIDNFRRRMVGNGLFEEKLFDPDKRLDQWRRRQYVLFDNDVYMRTLPPGETKPYSPLVESAVEDTPFQPYQVTRDTLVEMWRRYELPQWTPYGRKTAASVHYFNLTIRAETGREPENWTCWCGAFYRRPAMVDRGGGCPSCGRMMRFSVEAARDPAFLIFKATDEGPSFAQHGGR